MSGRSLSVGLVLLVTVAVALVWRTGSGERWGTAIGGVPADAGATRSDEIEHVATRSPTVPADGARRGIGASPAPLPPARPVEGTSRSLLVSSSAGIPLDELEWSFGGGRWTDAATARADSGGAVRVELPIERADVAVRARGHLARLVGAADVELRLEPDALLEIEMAGLEEAVTGIDLLEGHGAALRPALAWSLAGSRLALAVDASRFSQLNAGSDLSFSLTLDGHESLVVEAEVRAGLRAHALLPERAGDARLAPLRIELERGGEPWSGSRVAVEAWRDLSMETLSGHRASEWTYAWGTLRLELTERVFETEVAGSTATIDGLVIGGSYRVSAAAHDGSAGSVELVHGGRPVRLELLGGVLVRGTLDCGAEALPEHVDVEVSVPRPVDATVEPLSRAGQRSRWLGSEARVRVAPDGSFAWTVRRRGFPGRPPLRSTPPESLELVLSAPGFLPSAREVFTHGRFEVELGRVALIAQPTTFVLASHPFAPSADLAWSPVATSDGFSPGTYEILTASADEDGQLRVRLKPSDESAQPGVFSYRGSQAPGARPFPSPAPDAIVVWGPVDAFEGHVAVGFRRNGTSDPVRYEQVPSVRRTVRVDFPGVPDDSVARVRLGWTWEGVHVGTLSIRNELHSPRTLEVERVVPSGTTALWWTWERRGAGETWPPFALPDWSEEASTVLVGGR